MNAGGYPVVMYSPNMKPLFVAVAVVVFALLGWYAIGVANAGAPPDSVPSSSSAPPPATTTTFAPASRATTTLTLAPTTTAGSAVTTTVFTVNEPATVADTAARIPLPTEPPIAFPGRPVSTVGFGPRSTHPHTLPATGPKRTFLLTELAIALTAVGLVLLLVRRGFRRG